MNDRLSNAIARWLSHPTGIAQAIVTTSIWFSIPRIFHWPESAAVFWYLAYCTFISYATQFTLAYQNKKAETHMLNLMKLQVAMAEQFAVQQDEQSEDLEQSSETLKKLTDIAEQAVRNREYSRIFHEIRGLVGALEAGAREGGLPPELRTRIYKQILDRIDTEGVIDVSQAEETAPEE